jgi:lysosomal Pro-X carboxypeptidase
MKTKKQENLTADPVEPTVMYYNNVVDHYVNGGNVSNTYSQRYLFNDQYYDAATGPILFYAGNEGAIESFYENTQYIHQTLA